MGLLINCSIWLKFAKVEADVEGDNEPNEEPSSIANKSVAISLLRDEAVEELFDFDLGLEWNFWIDEN